MSCLPRRTSFWCDPEKENDALTTKQFLPRHPAPILRVRDYRNWQTILFRVTP